MAVVSTAASSTKRRAGAWVGSLKFTPIVSPSNTALLTLSFRVLGFPSDTLVFLRCRVLVRIALGATRRATALRRRRAQVEPGGWNLK